MTKNISQVWVSLLAKTTNLLVEPASQEKQGHYFTYCILKEEREPILVWFGLEVTAALGVHEMRDMNAKGITNNGEMENYKLPVTEIRSKNTKQGLQEWRAGYNKG